MVHRDHLPGTVLGVRAPLEHEQPSCRQPEQEAPQQGERFHIIRIHLEGEHLLHEVVIGHADAIAHVAGGCVQDEGPGTHQGPEVHEEGPDGYRKVLAAAIDLHHRDHIGHGEE